MSLNQLNQSHPTQVEEKEDILKEEILKEEILKEEILKEEVLKEDNSK